MLDFGVDGSGLFMKYLRRGSGYYIDVGASQLIIDGRIKLKSAAGVEQDQPATPWCWTTAPSWADLIVYATGYGSMNGWLADLVSPEVADKVGKCWGLGSTRPKTLARGRASCATCGSRQRRNLWIHGGNLHQSAALLAGSGYLALQLKARMEGLATPVYELQPLPPGCRHRAAGGPRSCP
jgi:putative flavoprotein involved in K+ transport